ncbi:hypothetical protein C8R44DRAFT_811825 [Mycena epipterygia]|nr:hypothetical protein C8R44DRAFT_811825 [Mycena epipterygia]
MDTPQEWDTYDDSSNLISPKQFTKYVLIPHVATALISEDLEISFEDALKVLDASADYGCHANADLPEDLDIVVTPPPKQEPVHPLEQSDPYAAETNYDNLG